ncbi:MAG: hydrolase [Rhodospirillaceae bacterium]|nr:hydrolase [Rhodospirillaceae bacterium]
MVSKFEDYCWSDIMDEGTLQIYRAYERPLRIGVRPAVLMIDVYQASYDGGQQRVVDVIEDYPSSCGERAWAMVEPAKQLLAAARTAGLPVIYSTGDERSNAEAGRPTNRVTMTETNDAYKILPELAPEPEDLVVYKQRASCFYGTPLMSHLVGIGVQSLIVGGGTTSGCLRAGVQDAKANGFHVTLVEECCYDRSPINHKVNLFDMHHKYADVMKLADVIKHLKAMTAQP